MFAYRIDQPTDGVCSSSDSAPLTYGSIVVKS